ncbi:MULTISPECIES: aldo/keto reductase [Clavibacter]|uniref:Aldo/keto reductase n=2 Tax=Clavibacter TaxID=1573 RepID=A0A399NWQ0_9MICO|nr:MULTISPECIES: aldo/keto reductase [Clavibacter]KDP89717.1 NADP-dependent aryl-alcohol dehydrogenase [Clavibacter cf. michiganensis LMG 26808]RII97056.1 aldo/keto reductase [Clavibacter michiganensis]UKF25948.1 aldo/keto reductase [Clavibacter sp. A6099]
MRYVKLGSTGTEVSAIALGCMSYGEPTRGNHAWTLSEEDSIPLIRRAVELGITFFDTANVYSDGSSEEITGRALKAMTKREEVVIATKVHGAMGEGPNSRGLSRKHIMWQIDESLRRLGTDHVDLYQIHRFDPATPLEETLEALDDLVRAGKVRYLGASSMDAWRFSKALHLQRANGWARFVTMQDHYNLVNREEEREMLPLCADEGVGSLPWSPLARGRLTRDWDATTDRSETDEFGKTLYAAQEDSDRRVAAAVAEVAGARGVPRAQVALAWVSRNPVVTAPIVGGTKVAHIEDAVASLDLELTDDEVSLLEEHYVPHAVVGY